MVGEDGRVGIRSSEFGQSDPNIWHRPSASETARLLAAEDTQQVDRATSARK